MPRRAQSVELLSGRAEVAAVMAVATAKSARYVDVMIYGQKQCARPGPDSMSVLAGVPLGHLTGFKAAVWLRGIEVIKVNPPPLAADLG